MTLLMYSSAFCEPCMVTRAVLAEVSALVPSASVIERDVTRYADEAERAGIRSTPTVLVLRADGTEAFRAEGVPTVNQVLVALAKAA